MVTMTGRSREGGASAYWAWFFWFVLCFFWLHWVFVAVRGLSLIAVSGGYSSLWCAGFSLQRLLLLQSMGSSHARSEVVVHGL